MSADATNKLTISTKNDNPCDATRGQAASLIPAFTFSHPFRCIINGPSQSGKTWLLFDILKNIDKLIQPKISSIIWFYGIWQREFDDLLIAMRQRHPHIDLEFREGVPQRDHVEKFADKLPRLLILDDLMAEANQTVVDLFTRSSHHLNLSVFFLTQNLYTKANKHSRDLNLNSTYLILFKNVRDASQINHIARQIFPGNSKFLVDAYKDATSAAPHSFLLIDMHPRTEEMLRVRAGSGLFASSDEKPQWIYVCKEK